MAPYLDLHHLPAGSKSESSKENAAEARVVAFALWFQTVWILIWHIGSESEDPRERNYLKRFLI